VQELNDYLESFGDGDDNQPLIGTVSITGKTEVYRTLTADLSLSKPDVAVSYQCQTDYTPDSYYDIYRATAKTYTLTPDDKGKNLKVTVTTIDNYGIDTYFTSEATCAVASFTINLDGIEDDVCGAVKDELATLPANTPETPYVVPFNLNNFSLNEFFTGIDTAVKSEEAGGKYIIPDLSGCIVLHNEIPNSYTGTGIEYPIFGIYSDGKDNIYIKGHILPDTLTKIGEKAFYRCEHLTSITILGSMTGIVDEAFALCKELARVTFGTGSDIEDDNFDSNASPKVKRATVATN